MKLCLVSVFPDIVKGCPEIRNLPKIFLRSFENVGSGGSIDGEDRGVRDGYALVCGCGISKTEAKINGLHIVT